jgi:hypothetical protein
LITVERLTLIFVINNLSPVSTSKKMPFLGKYRAILGKFIPVPFRQEFRMGETKSEYLIHFEFIKV